MERLTKYLASGAADYNYPADCYGGNDSNDRVAKSAYRQTCVERLAAYEDTGLTPAEVLPKDKADEIALKLMRLADLKSFCSYTRLQELAEADKDGRVVVLPCKVGDTVWTYCDYPAKRVYPSVVTDISTLNGRTMLNTSQCGVVDARDIGKTVFLTREEAEKALEAM